MFSRTIFLWLALTSFSSIAQFVLEPQPAINGQWQVNLSDLCQVAKNTQTYIEVFPEDEFAVHAGKGLFKGVDLQRVQQTLAFVCQLQQQNIQLTAEYLIEHFDFYRWLPDKQQADHLAAHSNNKVKKRLLTNIPEQQIFLTKYYTKLLTGNDKKTAKYNQALYRLPYDEHGLTLEQAEQQKAQLTRYKYTRQQILTGVLEQKKLAKPLIWVSEEALHDVLLQGTGVVEVNDTRRYFNVHRNNDIAYDYTLGKREQARYWYFAEVSSILGYGKTLASKIPVKENVTFAGNVAQLGLGKLFLINYNVGEQKINQLGVLADQGGAFDNNLFQLDFLRGSYRGWSDYYQANKHLPDYANAWLLLRK
ncbi:hypothetical protein tinsulaeT_21240 [Thalassotalea insulae]|uniref:Lytic transglycosylase MltA domain-containing protein n=1 Tax=Thalassotalea insulae TaxID=2056778 RepID=A0ABQ6GTY2_9GAMM|nr:MltA domain-containing protein [Thalassotalea insulae]GLX78784.1 hypothetical protein tinsulaeT_21240 [Thalassotalea insulae]